MSSAGPVRPPSARRAAQAAQAAAPNPSAPFRAPGLAKPRVPAAGRESLPSTPASPSRPSVDNQP